mmetsp:Transcript_8639/g.17702  ORF Transcript_8639/g.17702 Transcript_8639/m.17702 type:complete len:112 (-) Transcript_8639:633-968(-)
MNVERQGQGAPARRHYKKPFKGKCSRKCGKQGHKASDCKSDKMEFAFTVVRMATLLQGTVPRREVKEQTLELGCLLGWQIVASSSLNRTTRSRSFSWIQEPVAMWLEVVTY